MNLPAPRQPTPESGLPTTPFSEKSLANLRRAMTRIGGKPTLSSGHSITPSGHAKIAAKLSAFRQTLIAGRDDRQEIGIELARLLSSLPKQDPGVGAGLLVDAYREAIGSTPAWAVREARSKIIRGEANRESKFAPTPPELMGIINTVLAPYRRDLADLEALAEIEATPDQSAETKQMIGDGFDALAIEMGKNDPNKQSKHVPSDDEIRDAAKRWLA